MICFLRRADQDIKIGTTTDFHMRLSQLIAEHGDLELLGLMEGDRHVERELHVRFRETRRGRTEFFAPSQVLLDFIGENTTVNPPLFSETTTIRISPETAHVIRVIASARGITQGEVIQEAINNAFPEQVAAARAIMNRHKSSVRSN